MSDRLAAYRAGMRARKAAALGLTLDEYDAHCRREQEKLDAINRAAYDREHGWPVIEAHAERAGRTFVVVR